MITGVTRRAVTTGASERKRGSSRNHRSEREEERELRRERGREKELRRAEGVETERVRERKGFQLLRVLRVSGGEKIFFSF